MSTDAELLRRFAEERSEAAFTELVHRYLALVRSTALRRVGGDAHAADDITQQVFVSLARKAPSLRGHATLAGWLYVSTHHATAELVRREQRRKQREAAAHSMQLTDSSAGSPDEAARLRPLLDDALITLKPEEREAIVQRFFAGRTFAEIGLAVQLSEEAARKRVDRALDKLHAVLLRRGVTSTVGALGGALTAAGLDSAPAGLALKVAGAAMTQAVVPGLAASLAHLLWPAATAAALVVGTLALVPQHRANAEAATAIASRESDTHAAIGALQVENQRLARDLGEAKAAVEREKSGPAPVARPTPAASQRPATEVVVGVSTTGSLQWAGEGVRLDEFLTRLVRHQAENGESRFVVKADGARFMQLNWVLEEARKAGITHLVIESDAKPEGWMNTWF